MRKLPSEQRDAILAAAAALAEDLYRHDPELTDFEAFGEEDLYGESAAAPEGGNRMPSASLTFWQKDRMPRLSEVDNQCAASLALMPAKPELVDENLRGYVLLLSAHFQGFCRALYVECAQIVVSRVRPSLKVLLQRQCTTHMKLDHGNPNIENLKTDFGRFEFVLDLAGADPANPARIADLSQLNKWRNVAAHHGKIPVAPPLVLPNVQRWRNSCDGLAVSLDGIM